MSFFLTSPCASGTDIPRYCHGTVFGYSGLSAEISMLSVSLSQYSIHRQLDPYPTEEVVSIEVEGLSAGIFWDVSLSPFVISPGICFR